MTPLVELLNEAARLWWLHVFQATWQASLLACLVIAVVLLGRRWPSPLRYALVLLALVKFAVPPTLSAPTAVFRWLERPAVAVPLGEVEPATTLRPASAVPATRSDVGTAAAAIAPQRPRLCWQVWPMMIHGIGMIAVGLWILRRLNGLRWAAAEARPVSGGPLREMVVELCAELGLRRAPRLLVSARPHPPAAFGLRRPTVILAEEMLTRMPAAELRAVLAHELAHHRRGDLWLNGVQILLAVVWWFNPVFHWLSRTIRGVREDCCDDLLLASRLTTDRSYCDALLSTAGVVADPGSLSHALGFADRFHPLGRRLTRIMDRTLRRPRRLSWVGGLLIVLMACLMLPGRSLVGGESDGALAELLAEEAASREEVIALAMLSFQQEWPAYVLERLRQALPEQTSIERLELTGERVTADGRVTDSRALARFGEQLGAEPLLAVEALSLVEGSRPARFQLVVQPSFLSVGGGQPALERSLRNVTEVRALRQAMAERRRRQSARLERFIDGGELAQALRRIRTLARQAQRQERHEGALARAGGHDDEGRLGLDGEVAAHCPVGPGLGVAQTGTGADVHSEPDPGFVEVGGFQRLQVSAWQVLSQ
ncbi:MAG: M48 family metalloprotease [bacterium]|nr:M48 family metalloprotease [bacterium]